MTRVKRGTTALKRRRAILKRAKGYRQLRSTKLREARVAVLHAGNHAFAHRRDKKNDFRRLWTTRINAAVREHGMNYSQFINALNKKNIALDRKSLSNLAVISPGVFKKIVEEVKS